MSVNHTLSYCVRQYRIIYLYYRLIPPTSLDDFPLEDGGDEEPATRRYERSVTTNGGPLTLIVVTLNLIIPRLFYPSILFR